ncbi:MAG: hypothetical protein C0175_00990 [Caldisericum exile]|uniref:Uncharacterized protein n=1 Tax=Caldisericum exile TaxID=693075 RepID=A0A2J6X957_9BACT|nr:MAG: hypothetical protein C0175_00990 [Caldisericum exile]
METNELVEMIKRKEVYLIAEIYNEDGKKLTSFTFIENSQVNPLVKFVVWAGEVFKTFYVFPVTETTITYKKIKEGKEIKLKISKNGTLSSLFFIPTVPTEVKEVNILENDIKREFQKSPLFSVDFLGPLDSKNEFE